MRDVERARLARRKIAVLRGIAADERVPWRLREQAKRAADAVEVRLEECGR
jgi:uncharacterized protein (UPF0147 family)